MVSVSLVILVLFNAVFIKISFSQEVYEADDINLKLKETDKHLGYSYDRPASDKIIENMQEIKGHNFNPYFFQPKTPNPKNDLHNPLLTGLLQHILHGLNMKVSGNSYNLVPINPYIALYLSHYGSRYSYPLAYGNNGLYGYAASNNYHNNKPFGSYKLDDEK